MSNSIVFPLDIVYALLLPEHLPADLSRSIQFGLDRHRICESTNGAVIACDRVTDLWNRKLSKPQKYASSHGGAGPWEKFELDLVYAEFPGNQEITRSIAKELSTRFGVHARIRRCEYEDLAFGSRKAVTDAARLVLIASPWPHPVSMLAPFYFSNCSDSFRAAFKDAAAAPDLSAATDLAAHAEEILVNDGCRIVIVGQPIGCVRSRIGKFYCPPSGWIDFAFLEESVI